MAAIDENKSLGQVLSDLPIETLLTGMGNAIAKTQAALDKNSIDGLQRLAEAKLKLRDRDGKEVEKSLIELGFAPAFYFFSEATLDLVMTISIHLTESSSDSVGLVVGGSISGGTGGGQPGQSGQGQSGGSQGSSSQAKPQSDQPANQKSDSGGKVQGAAVFGLAFSHESARKFGYDASGTTRISVKLVSVPPPGALTEALKNHQQGIEEVNKQRVRELEERREAASQRELEDERERGDESLGAAERLLGIAPATKPADAKPADAKPADTKPADAKPADAKPADTKPADAKPADAKPADTKPADAKPADAKPADAKPADAKPADTKPADAKPADEEADDPEPKAGG